ncbi:hypothetical protein OTK49_28300 [Vibrio coralliirubri]|uniref:hypothetical protein n=1 Tax=Vibrio coralliirubri TaxID=1516159 RepID=UPI0022853891|nr:hypothetical protein [Vibrio coralliirubri]MCY9866445.1 hypothetical protein [Vibrio coralliirubri]
MKVFDEKNFDILKELVAQLLDLSDDVELEAIMMNYVKLTVCVNQTKGFYEVHRAKIDDVADPVDIAFGVLIDNLAAYLLRGGFDFEAWRHCLEYIMYDINDDMIVFERDVLKRSH